MCIGQFVFIAILVSNRAGHVSLTVCNLVMICFDYTGISLHTKECTNTDKGNRSNRENTL